MSADFDPSADAAITMSAGGAGAAGTGAHTLVVLFYIPPFAATSGLLNLLATSTQVRQILVDVGSLFGANDFSSGYAALVLTDAWYVAALSKPAGSAHYRGHIWPYASDGSGTMLHGEAVDAANHGDGSAITQFKIGLCDTRGNGLIAAVGIWNSELSDANLNTLKSPNLSAWADLSPAELVSLEDWDGTNGATAVVGTSAKTGITGTVGAGGNPPSFDFSVGGAIDLVVANATQAQTADNVALTQTHELVSVNAAQAQTSGSPALTQTHELIANGATQAQSADNATLTQTHVLTADGAAQAQTSDTPALTQVHSLIVADAGQAQSADNVILVVGGTDLVVADAIQSQMADNVTLTQLHQLGIQSAMQVLSSDVVGSLIPDAGTIQGAVTATAVLVGSVSASAVSLAGIIE